MAPSLVPLAISSDSLRADGSDSIMADGLDFARAPRVHLNTRKGRSLLGETTLSSPTSASGALELYYSVVHFYRETRHFHNAVFMSAVLAVWLFLHCVEGVAPRAAWASAHKTHLRELQTEN